MVLRMDRAHTSTTLVSRRRGGFKMVFQFDKMDMYLRNEMHLTAWLVCRRIIPSGDHHLAPPPGFQAGKLVLSFNRKQREESSKLTRQSSEESLACFH